MLYVIPYLWIETVCALADGISCSAYLRLVSMTIRAVDLSVDDSIDTFTRVIKSINICLWLKKVRNKRLVFALYAALEISFEGSYLEFQISTAYTDEADRLLFTIISTI